MSVDMFGQPVFEGSIVSYNPPHYKGLRIGVVVKITPKMFRVCPLREEDNGYYYNPIYSQIANGVVLAPDGFNPSIRIEE